MKALITATLLVLGVSFAQAEEAMISNLPTNAQESVMTSADEQAQAVLFGHHTGKYNYCCVQSHGGGYCSLSYYDNYGAPCKCYVGNNAANGHVCN